MAPVRAMRPIAIARPLRPDRFAFVTDAAALSYPYQAVSIMKPWVVRVAATLAILTFVIPARANAYLTFQQQCQLQVFCENNPAASPCDTLDPAVLDQLCQQTPAYGPVAQPAFRTVSPPAWAIPPGQTPAWAIPKGQVPAWSQQQR